MNIIHKSDYRKVGNCIHHNKTVPTFTYSVLDGYIDGKVYTDSSLMQTILVETHNGLYFVSGCENNEEFNRNLINLYRGKKSRNHRFTLFSPSEKWDALINHLLKNEVIPIHRYSFTYTKENVWTKVDQLPEDFYLSRINADFIKESSEFNEAYYEQYWSSTQDFLDKGIGYAVVHNGEPVSECTSIFRSSEYSEIDIATRDGYKGKGLATILAQTFINNSLANNLTPRWDCDVANGSSMQLARKLAFHNPIEYSIFVIK